MNPERRHFAVDENTGAAAANSGAAEGTTRYGTRMLGVVGLAHKIGVGGVLAHQCLCHWLLHTGLDGRAAIRNTPDWRGVWARPTAHYERQGHV